MKFINSDLKIISENNGTDVDRIRILNIKCGKSEIGEIAALISGTFCPLFVMLMPFCLIFTTLDIATSLLLQIHVSIDVIK